MKAFVVFVQEKCGPRANPVNHVSKVAVCAQTEEQAHAIALRMRPSAVSVVKVVTIEAGDGFVVSV
jgi:hypothetical protein